jgi:spore maturation protein CgeB
LNILYLGPTSRATTSGHRAHALQRLGHSVAGVNITSSFNFNRLKSKIHYITGYRFIQGYVFDALNTSLEELSFACDLIWIDGGQYFGAQVLAWLKKAFRAPIVLYNVDDPTGPRDACSFHTLKRSFCHYSLCVFVRQESSLEALALGAKRVVTVSRSFDEVEHLEASLDTCVNDEVHSLSFLGTNIPGEKRDVILVNLLRDGVPLRISGDLYDRSRFWDEIKPFHQKQSINSDYVSLIQASIACLGLLSHHYNPLT